MASNSYNTPILKTSRSRHNKRSLWSRTKLVKTPHRCNQESTLGQQSQKYFDEQPQTLWLFCLDNSILILIGDQHSHVCRQQALNNGTARHHKISKSSLTTSSWISCSFVARRITSTFSRRVDSCCCCCSLASDSRRAASSSAFSFSTLFDSTKSR